MHMVKQTAKNHFLALQQKAYSMTYQVTIPCIGHMISLKQSHHRPYPESYRRNSNTQKVRKALDLLPLYFFLMALCLRHTQGTTKILK